MTRPAALVVLVLAHALAGCDSRSRIAPIAPSSPALPPADPSPGAASPERWTVAGTYIGHTGPEACIPPFDGKAGQPENGLVLIERSGRTIRLSTEHDRYAGVIDGVEFATTVDGEYYGGTWQCGDARTRFSYEGGVSGRFSDDGRSLTAIETAVFRLESGGAITRRWTWSGTRQ